jgi:hypothetical protein
VVDCPRGKKKHLDAAGFGRVGLLDTI